MNIGIDIDDTICNTYETTIPYLKNYMENKLGIHFKMDLSSMVDYYNLASRFNINSSYSISFLSSHSLDAFSTSKSSTVNLAVTI